MLARTHLIGGALASTIFIKAITHGDFGLEVISPAMAMTTIPFTMIGSLFPDIDLKNSKISNTVKPISFVTTFFFGHRTMFHSPLLLALIYFLIVSKWAIAKPFVLAFVVGGASHLILDFFNKKGISFFWPIPSRFWIMGIETGKNGEKIFSILLLIILIITIICVIIQF